MAFRRFGKSLRGFLHGVESRGVRGLDADGLAADLAEREVRGLRVSVRGAAGNYRRGEARRRAVERIGARAAGWTHRADPKPVNSRERRAFADAIREARQSLTGAEAAAAAGSFLAGWNRSGPRPGGPLLRRAGDLLLESLRRRCDFDMALARDPRCVRILLAGMRMWRRGEDGPDGAAPPPA